MGRFTKELFGNKEERAAAKEERLGEKAIAKEELKGAWAELKAAGKEATDEYKSHRPPSSLSDAGKYGLSIVDGTKVHDKKDTRIGGEIVGARASVSTEGEIRERVTATRILATGVFALAFKKKKDKRELFMTVEGDDFLIVSDPIDIDKADKARKFARAFNGYAAELKAKGEDTDA